MKRFLLATLAISATGLLACGERPAPAPAPPAPAAAPAPQGIPIHIRIIQGSRKGPAKVIKQTVRPEFINRIDEIVMFTPLTNANIAQIVGLQLKSVTKMLALQGITMDATPQAIAYLSEKGYDQQFGARPLNRAIQKYLEDPIAEEILKGEIEQGGTLLADYPGDGDLLIIKVKKAKEKKEKKAE